MRTEAQKEASRRSASRWYYAHKEKAKAYSKAWAAVHPERRKEIANASARRTWMNDTERLRKKCREWMRANRDKVNAYKRMRKKEDPEFRLLENLRVRLYSAVKGTTKSESTTRLVGCGIRELMERLESLFEPGMSWENYGPVWHVDHIRPCASFNLIAPAQQRECFHYSNLQPLFAEENVRKGSRV